jgi:putative restriction endonuclease
MYVLGSESEWDVPFFKKLAHNDTGAASGHQGGIVVPKDLRPFFPSLSDADASAIAPTSDRRIVAELFVEGLYLSTASTRYQYQTWGGERSPESRLTDQLTPLRSLARGEDYLVFQRCIDRLDLYRLTLVRQTSDQYAQIADLAGARRWGVLGSSMPLTHGDVVRAAAVEAEAEEDVFRLFDDNATFDESRVTRISRSVAFRERVIRLYNFACTVCGLGLRTPSGRYELDAAHIVPRSKLGRDDARNGLSLCKRHHWAFDCGMFGVSDSFRILVPDVVSSIPANESLAGLSGEELALPADSRLHPHPQAFEWHRSNILLRE